MSETKLIPVDSISGHNIGWIHPSTVVFVGPNSGQRIVRFDTGDGRIQEGCRKYGYSDAAFMLALGLGDGNG